MMHLAITAIDRAGSKSYYHETNDRSSNDQIPEAAISRERARNTIPGFTRTHSQHRIYVRPLRECIHLMSPDVFRPFPPIDHGFVGFETVSRVFPPRAQVLQIIVLISCNNAIPPRMFYHQHERRHDTSSIEFTELLAVENQMDGFPDFAMF